MFFFLVVQTVHKKGEKIMKKTFKELDLSNAFLFAAALEDPEMCQLVLELILEEPIGPVRVTAERTVLFSTDFRCVRLDVYASDKMNVGYNLEMQNKNEGNLPKRSRYHQAEMDLTSLKSGEDFNDLKPSSIIFICAFDPFGYNLYRYTFEERCKEVDIALGDETKTIFLSTTGKNETEVPAVLIHFLKYVENSTDECVEQSEDLVLAKIHQKIKKLKSSRELEERYMQFEELLSQERNEGRLEGESKKLIELIKKKLDKGLDAAVIAEFVEVPLEVVDRIAVIIRENPSMECEEILEKVKEAGDMF